MFDGLQKRDHTTREEYIAELCLKNSVTPEQIAEALDIEPCNCSYAGCTGWLAMPKRKPNDRTSAY